MDKRVGRHNLARLAEDAAERKGSYDALWFEGTTFTSTELFDRSRRMARGLTALGLAPGDPVMVVAANTPEVGILYSACWRAGLVVVPALFLLPPPELRHIIDDAVVRAVVTTPEFLPNVQAAAAGADSVRHLICIDRPDGMPDVLDLTALESHDPAPIVGRHDEDLAALLYTGGTTGRSKGVMLTHANLWHGARSGMEASRVDGITRTAVPLPLSHSFGLLVSVSGAHEDSQTLNGLMRWFDPAGFVSLVEEQRMQRATLVPAMLQLLLAQPLEDHDLSSLEFIICGSAPLPRPVLEAFESRVPSATICEGYGLTETAAATTVNPPHHRKVGTVGPPLPGFDLRILDDDGTEVPTGTPGEVVVRSKSVAAGYWGAEDATHETFVDEWCHTGDIGAVDEDGYLTILDRKKDLIIRNGFNVYPADVEEALAEHEGIVAAGVIGRLDTEVGEEVVAFVQPAPGVDLDPAEVRAWARDRLGGKSYPREVHVVDAIPRTPVMKVDRKALRELV